MANFSQAVQSSVLAGPKILVGGRQPTEKCALELVLKCRFSEALGARVSYGRAVFYKASDVEMCTIRVQENLCECSRKFEGISRALYLYY